MHNLLLGWHRGRMSSGGAGRRINTLSAMETAPEHSPVSVRCDVFGPERIQTEVKQPSLGVLCVVLCSQKSKFGRARNYTKCGNTQDVEQD